MQPGVDAAWHMTLLPRQPVLLLPLPKSHLQAFTSRLLYNNLHGEQRGSRDVGSCSRSSSSAQSSSSPPALIADVAASNLEQSPKLSDNDAFARSSSAKPINTTSRKLFRTSGSVGQCANSAVRGPASVSRACRHWASLHDISRSSATFYEPGLN
ncbi:BQ5605_C011g06516 [Microbotryum silenes-dioicae]|uniref:BQ5605_C011g06516 protein n=1 Tax=Microbotryum silenes-dioicae TaxID=796604 RepID=A0A2X0LPC5_9BASI|nr:BQ5605_C011g06516 [Microbotryum silenes-dioicae]